MAANLEEMIRIRNTILEFVDPVTALKIADALWERVGNVTTNASLKQTISMLVGAFQPHETKN